MWTYRRPRRDLEITPDSIEYNGKIALYRALNIGRVVAFVGAGVSVPYGRPTWDALVVAAVNKIGALIGEEVKKADGQVEASLIFQARELLLSVAGMEDISDLTINDVAYRLKKISLDTEIEGAERKVIVLALVMRLSKQLNKTAEYLVREAAAKAAYAEERDYLSEKKENLSQHIFENSYAHVAIQKTIIDATSKWKEHRKEPFGVAVPAIPAPDCVLPNRSSDGVISTILGKLRIRRFLTLNYDLEIERAIVAKYGLHNQKDRGHLVTLVEETLYPTKEGGRRRRADDNRVLEDTASIEATARSTTISNETIGQLVNFAAHPGKARAQVFHLHGRVDDPRNMVLSEEDYQDLYLGSDLNRRTFHESLKVLFRGNEILFMGIGMTEQDILRPLRQFVSQERSANSEGRHVFALLPTISEAKDYDSAKVSAATQTMGLMVQYGVHVLRYGDEAFWKAFTALNSLKKKLDNIVTDSKINIKNKKKMCNIFNCFNKHNADLLQSINNNIKDECIEYIEYFDFLEKSFNILGLSSERYKKKDNLFILDLKETVKLLMSRLMARALERKLNAISADQQAWWNEWRKAPTPREARFRSPVKPGSSGDTLVWMRQEPHNILEDWKAQSSGLNAMFADLQKAVAAQIDPTPWPNRRRVASVVVPRGGGKGNLLRQLVHDNQFETIFPSFRKQTRQPVYLGVFVAHLSFVIEFNSVLEALILFLEEIIKRILKKNKNIRIIEMVASAKNNLISGEHPIDTIRSYFKILSDVYLLSSFESGRVLLVFYGIDRLCNASGIPLNAGHRAFFRALTGYGKYYQNEDIPGAPLDILFLTGRENTPVRYTTEIKSKSGIEFKDRTSNSYQEIGRSGYFQKVPPVIGGTPLKERAWLERSVGRDLFGILEGKLKFTGSGRPSRTAPILSQLVSEDVALSAWVFQAARDTIPINTCNEIIDNWLEDAEFEASRHQVPGLIGFVLSKYAAKDGKQKESIQDDLILKHLALFPIPVEILVLFGCPDVREHLTEGTGTLQQKRMTRLESLQRSLDKLVARHLVIRIVPTYQDPSSTHSNNTKIPCAPVGTTRIHYRYTVHPRLREYFSHRMDFPLPDRDDAGLFRVSLYPYQGRDRPKASRVHYKLVKEIIRYQIGRSRNSLWNLYKLDRLRRGIEEGPFPAAGSMDWWKNDLPLMKDGLRRRMTVPKDDRNPFEDGFASFHAISQRIRACYSLLRGGFSVGTINQISAAESGPKSDQPLERYHTWLQALNNQATALAEVRKTLKWLAKSSPVFGSTISGTDFIEFQSEYGSWAGHRWGEINALIDWVVVQNRDKRDPYKVTIVNPENPKDTRRLKLKDQIDVHINQKDAEGTGTKLKVAKFKRALYVDEIGWMQNERGVLAYAQGNLFDALPLFESALQTMSHLERPRQNNPSRHSTERRIQLNQALTRIDRGHLGRARKELEGLLVDMKAPWSSQSITSRLASGYIGLIDHLGGSKDSAHKAYTKILKFADGEENLRVAAIFHRHLADLLRSMGRADEAEEEAQKAESAARQAGQQGMLHQARLTHAKILMNKGDWVRAQGMIQDALDYAEDLGMPKVKAEALEVSADLMSRQGETTLSGETAADAIALANRYGMRLRKISSLEILGTIMTNRKQTELALDVLREARVEAERCRYQARVGSISNKLMALRNEDE